MIKITEKDGKLSQSLINQGYIPIMLQTLPIISRDSCLSQSLINQGYIPIVVVGSLKTLPLLEKVAIPYKSGIHSNLGASSIFTQDIEEEKSQSLINQGYIPIKEMAGELKEFYEEKVAIPYKSGIHSNV